MNIKAPILIVSAAVLSTLFITIFIVQNSHEKYLTTIDRYFETSAQFKQSVLQNVAIYEDYAESGVEKELRTYLLDEHLIVAHNGKYEQAKNDKELETWIKEKKITPVPNGADDPVYFYNVPQEYRYLRDFTIDGINLLTKEFQKNLPEQIPGVRVKLAISSAMRPVSYQNNLRGKNENASLESTHSYGISFDIFYDDYYVSIVPQADKKYLDKKIFEKIRKRHGFSLGGDLRRQFQTVLSKTLIQLQREKKLYAIIETNQRCYHVTILPQK